MLTVKIICMGKIKEKFFQAAIDEYSKRLSGYCKLEIAEIPEVKFSSDSAPRAEIDAALKKEATLILSKIPERAKVVALCVEGREMPTEKFAQYIADAAVSGASTVCFVIGSSYGLCEDVKKRADLRLSFSQMTFPHQLMRVVLAEQIYRAFKINSGETYHK